MELLATTELEGNMEKLTDHEKSLEIGKVALGWTLYNEHNGLWNLGKDGFGHDEVRSGWPNLYETFHMALAWRVHLWGLKYEEYLVWLEDTDDPLRYSDSQRMWLDKILEICTEARKRAARDSPDWDAYQAQMS